MIGRIVLGALEIPFDADRLAPGSALRFATVAYPVLACATLVRVDETERQISLVMRKPPFGYKGRGGYAVA